MARVIVTAFAIAIVATSPIAAAAFAVPAGGEFHVNTYTTDYQFGQRICGRDDGTFVVTWMSYYQDGDQLGVFGQRFDGSGGASGTEFLVNSYTTGSQFSPNLCCTPGGFVVVWSSAQDQSSYGIVGQRFDVNGNRVGTEFVVNTYTTGFQAGPAACCEPDGDFVVVWNSSGQDGDDGGVFGQRFDAGANTVGTEFQVNSYTTDRQGYPVLSCDGSGGFVAAWDSGPTFIETDVRARRFDASANPVGPDFVANSYTTGEQNEPSLCHDAAGDFVIVWQSGVSALSPPDADGSGGGCFGQRYDASGSPNGTEFLVNASFTSGSQRDPAVACRDDGEFTVAYNDGGYGAYSAEIRGQRFDTAGFPLGTQFRVNTYSANYQSGPEIAHTDDGTFVVVWRSYEQESTYDYSGVYGRRFTISPTTTTTLPYGGVAQPDGGEFQINTFTTQNQQPSPQRAVARAADGSFVVVWTGSANQDGSNDGIFGQRFDETGDAVGSEFQVNTYTTGAQRDADVAMLENDGFVVVWSSSHDSATSGVFGQVFGGDGLPVGTEFRANGYTTSTQSDPKVAGDDDGTFVVVWESSGQDGNGTGVFARRFDSAAQPLGTDFQVNSYTTDDQTSPAVARRAGTGFVVVWTNEASVGGYGVNITGQLYDDAGTTIGTEFVVSTYTSASQAFASVDMDAAGRFVVVWQSFFEDGYFGFGPGIFGRHYDNTATPLTGEIHVNEKVADYQTFPDVAVNDDGSFVVVWQSDQYIDFSGYAVAGRFFDDAADPRGGQFQINAYTTGDQAQASIAGDGAGNFVVVWRNARPQDGSFSGVFGQLYCADLDHNGLCDSLVCADKPSGQHIDIKPRVILSKINTDPVVNDDRLTIKGEMLLPLSTGFSSLDPGSKGARIRLERADGTAAVDISLPAGAAWSINGAANKWLYKDKTGSVGGISTMIIKDRRTVGPNQIKLIVKGRDGSYPVVSGDEPIQAAFVLGDAFSGADGECGSTSFAPGDCVFNGKGNKLICR